MTSFNANGTKQRARAAAQSGLYKAGRLVAEASLEKVPRDTGKLAQSIYMKPGENGLSMEVGYSADYASAVHDKDEKKFLTLPFLRLKESIFSEVKASIEEAIR